MEELKNLESILKNVTPEMYNIDAIKPYEKNAKMHDEVQINNVAESIKQFGFVQPIVIDKNNEIIIGHCRYEASKKLNLDKVPCVKVTLSKDKVKKLRILDNKLNESAWDFSLLADDIIDLDFDGFNVDLGISNISQEDIDKFFSDIFVLNH
jgi:ParB-like chromosome segregation protein Spo0J